jgi:Uncharacterized protein conserved in bacteria
MVVSGTGHRPQKLGGFSKGAFNKLHTIATEWLLENKPEKVISGMALGWDMALAQASIDLDIPLIAAVPFKGQEGKWNLEDRLKYFELLLYAERIVYVCEPGYSPWKMQVRNEWMVKNSDIVLAMWDGTEGGTNNCIRYAEDKMKKTIINLYDKFKNYG